MAFVLCSLCQNTTESVEFDLEKTFTPCSKMSFLTLLRSCTTENFLIPNYLICYKCYGLLNDLDTLRNKVRIIEDKLKSFLTSYQIKRTLKNEEKFGSTNKEEDCTICFKKVSSKEFKRHLKSHNEMNDLVTGFDFDEINSISEINPSLEDITLMGGEEAKEKSKFLNDSYVPEPKGDNKKVRKKTRDNLKPYKCLECTKTWKSLAELKNHMSTHNNERPYICEICGQAYKRQQALTIHVGMHKGINPFTCVYCNKSFTQKGALVRHTPIHTGELPFQCDLCGKRFVHHTSFNMHKLSHTGEKSYKCDLCGLMLMSGSHLKRHMRVHTGEKKFSCNTCGKKFAEKYNLAVHEKLHLGLSKKKKYQCQICDSFYSGQVKLEEHLFSVHQKIKTEIP